MRINLFTLLFVFATLQLQAQDFLSAQGPTLPGTISLNDGKTVTGKVSYSYTTVFVQEENSRVVSYPAADVSGFTLQEGGGEFISIAHGKKNKHTFFEIVSAKNSKLMQLCNATSIDRHGKTKDENGIKITRLYNFYSADEKQLIDADLKEISAFLKTRCEGISSAITEYKDKAYHFGMMATEEEKKGKYLRIVDDYVNNKCTYIPRDY